MSVGCIGNHYHNYSILNEYYVICRLSKTISSIGKSLGDGMNSVYNKLNDPNLQKEVKEKAAAGWSWLSSTASSIWAVAKDTAASIAAELNEEGGIGGPSAGATPTGQSVYVI